MHSNWQIWDFLTTHNREMLKNAEGIIALSTFDAICLKIIKDFLTKEIPCDSLHYKTASEVTKDWILEEFQTLSLFGNSESFFIHNAEELNLEMIELLSKTDISGRFVLLSFETTPAIFKKIIKENIFKTITIDEPRFRETQKLLDFVCSYLRLPLSYEAKTWLLDAIENNLFTFYNCCCLIKLNFPESREVSLNAIRELLTPEKVDKFQLASLFARKKTADFYDKLLQVEADFEKMRALFMFLQSHLIKMSDINYLAHKPKPTSYDREIVSASKIWKQAELNQSIHQFNNWEIKCKKRDDFLWHEIRLEQLRTISKL